MQEKILEIIDEYKKKTKKECYSIEYLDSEPNILDDKIGGIPYLPIGEEYPTDIDGNPMSLLFQINLKNVELVNFPNKGILEFFISSNENAIDLFDFEYENYSTIKYFNEGLEYQTSIVEIKNLFIDTPIKIQLRKNSMSMPYNMRDKNTVNLLLDIIEEKYNIQLRYPMEITNQLEIDYYTLIDEIEKECRFTSSVGGYPRFINEPDISYDIKQDECLLFICSNLERNLCFGPDAGSVYVFINKDGLINCNFNKFYCNFEC